MASSPGWRALGALTLLLAVLGALLVQPGHGQPNAAPAPKAAKDPKAAKEPKFCVVVRTYWGHSNPQGGLRRLLRSLQRQNIQNWEAVLLVLDSRPFADLHHLVAEMNDNRIWVFAEWIGPQYQPKPDTGTGEWTPGYHMHLYNLTDDTIQVCPPDTDWLVVTNGDNEYGQGFFQAVADTGAPGVGADVVAFDFYSRFQRITAPACVRFYAWENSPACKRNRLRWCHTDLGANVFNHQRFVAERRRFGGLQAAAGEGVSADHFDGVMASELIRGGWRVRVLEDVCLFNHAPSFHSCGWRGGVWDDRDVVSWNTAGGVCITPEEADAILASDPNAEETIVRASTDNRTDAFEGVSAGPHDVRCLRRKDYTSVDVWGRAMDWFSMLCADDVDVASYQAWEGMKARGEHLQQAQQPQQPQEAQQTAEAAAAAAAAAAQQQERSNAAVHAAAAQQVPQGHAVMAGGNEVDYWALQQEFYRAGVANAPDPPPKGAPEAHMEVRELFDAGQQAAPEAVATSVDPQQQQPQELPPQQQAVEPTPVHVQAAGAVAHPEAVPVQQQ